MNRNVLSYFSTIILAEHVLGWVPKGTHSIEKYIKPTELESFCDSAGLKVRDISGMAYNPLLQKWSLLEGKSCADLAINYILTSQKNQ